jgi:hypothetical protein
MNHSPYMQDERLQDVIAAIQFLASFSDYDLTAEKFREKIGIEPRSAKKWSDIFADHPEFFRKSETGNDYSLIMRRAKQKGGDSLRPPLSAPEMAMLFDTAMHLQKHALEMRREGRALYPYIVSAGGAIAAFLGAILGALIRSN